MFVNSTLFNPNSQQQGHAYSEYSRYVYDTTGGLLISRQWLESTDGSGLAMGYTDLRQVDSSSDSWTGPSVVLITSDELDLDALKGSSDSAEIVSARLLQQSVGIHGSTRASGYELTVAVGIKPAHRAAVSPAVALLKFLDHAARTFSRGSAYGSRGMQTGR